MLIFIFIFFTNLNAPKKNREENSNIFSQNTQSISSSDNSLLTSFSSQENSFNSTLNDLYTFNTQKKIENLIFLDTETTGVTNNDEIIEIAAIKYSFEKNTRIFTEQDTFHQRIKPNKKITKNSEKIHKITQEELNECPNFKDITQAFLKFIEDSKIVAYNSSFDIRMLNLEFERLNFQIPNTNEKIKKLKYKESINPLKLAKQQIKKTGKKHQYTLLNVAKYLKIKNIDEKKLHNALPDAKLLFEVYKKLIVKKNDLHTYGFLTNNLN